MPAAHTPPPRCSAASASLNSSAPSSTLIVRRTTSECVFSNHNRSLAPLSVNITKQAAHPAMITNHAVADELIVLRIRSNRDSIWSLRRLLSILLLAFLGLPAASSMLAATTQNAQTGLLACCRRNGAHHCVSAAEMHRAAKNPQLASPMGKCPYCPATVGSGSHLALFLTPHRDSHFVEPMSHPAGIAQRESKLRISQSRSRQKRGPPVTSSL